MNAPDPKPMLNATSAPRIQIGPNNWNPDLEVDLLAALSNTGRLRFQVVKTVLDVGVSVLVLLFVLSWLMPLLMLLIILDSGRPVFFVQERIGKDCRPFRCYKLRTMAPVKGAPEHLQKISRFGVFVRNTKLDEIPQFLNVLKGEMSIVGPRPHMLIDHNDFSARIGQCYYYRLLVKPGITGLAQVNGHEGPITSLKMLRGRIFYDLSYIQHWSVGKELRIMWKTAQIILAGLIRKPDPSTGTTIN